MSGAGASGPVSGVLFDAPGTMPAQVYPLVDVRALDRPFDYAVPSELDTRAVRGALVAVRLGHRHVIGVVAGRAPATHRGPLSRLAGVVEAEPIPADLWDLAGWVSRYYLAPMAACVRLVLPPGAEGVLRRTSDGSWRLATPPRGPAQRQVVRALVRSDQPDVAGVALSARRRGILEVVERAGGVLESAQLQRQARTTGPTLRRMAEAGLIQITTEGVGPSALVAAAGPAPMADRPPELNPAQRAAVEDLVESVQQGTPLLLHGVTGSGKTEVYLRAIEHARKLGRTCLVLVPEIALTPQLLGRLRARLGERVAVWHSALSLGERAEEYRRVRAGEADVVMGARSAIFAPLANLGLIVVDEEHDASYKQDSSPRYDARQVAVRRARHHGAAVVFGSATPRPETWHVLDRTTLSARADGSRLPRVEVVDMRTQSPGPISRPLARALHAAAARGEKAIVMACRRGFSLVALCRECGWICRCPDCDVALVHHRDPARLACHHCGHEQPPPQVCPNCASVDLARQGTGTQGVEQELRRLVPAARLVRMDGSTTTGRGAVARLLAEFAQPGPAILLGTQMVAKGHDLPAVTVAGVIDADAPLQHADFRSEERAFGLIVQVAGRAGRRGEDAKVIVQAFEPLARAVTLGADHAVPGFLDGEVERRRRHGLPPFSHLVRLVVDADEEQAASRVADLLADTMRDNHRDIGLLGPAPLHRLRGRHRRALLLRAPRATPIVAAVGAMLAGQAPALRSSGARVTVDVDPQST